MPITVSSIAFLPVLLGILVRVTDVIIEKPSDLRKRINLIETNVLEILTRSFDHLLEQVRLVIGTSDVLRDLKVTNVDKTEQRTVYLIDTYTRELHKSMRAVRVIEGVRSFMALGYFMFLATTLSGVVLMALTLSIRNYYITLIVLSLSILVLQIIFIVLMFFQLSRLRQYETISL